MYLYFSNGVLAELGPSDVITGVGYELAKTSWLDSQLQGVGQRRG